MSDMYQQFSLPQPIFWFNESMFDLFQQFSVPHPVFCLKKFMFDFYVRLVSTLFSTSPYFLLKKIYVWLLWQTCINTFKYLALLFVLINLCLTSINNFNYHNLFFGVKNLCLTSMSDLYQHFSVPLPTFCYSKSMFDMYVRLVSTVFSTITYFFSINKSMSYLYQQFSLPHPIFYLKKSMCDLYQLFFPITANFLF